jgi:hypothetical protein
MTIHVTFSDASIEKTRDDRLLTRIFVRPHSGVPFTQIVTLKDYPLFHAHVSRCAGLSDEALIAELRDLKRSQRETHPGHWGMWHLTFLLPTSFVHDLDWRAGELTAKSSDGAKIRKALAHARRALGLGARWAGAPRQQKDRIPTGLPEARIAQNGTNP